MHLRQPGFTYSDCGLFNRKKEGIQKFKAGNLRCIYKNKLDKTCSQNDIASGDLPRITASDKVLYDKGFNIILKIENIMDVNGNSFQWFTKFLINMSAGSVVTLANKSAIKNENISNLELAEELQKTNY